MMFTHVHSHDIEPFQQVDLYIDPDDNYFEMTLKIISYQIRWTALFISFGYLQLQVMQGVMTTFDVVLFFYFFSFHSDTMTLTPECIVFVM